MENFHFESPCTTLRVLKTDFQKNLIRDFTLSLRSSITLRNSAFQRIIPHTKYSPVVIPPHTTSDIITPNTNHHVPKSFVPSLESYIHVKFKGIQPGINSESYLQKGKSTREHLSFSS